MNLTICSTSIRVDNSEINEINVNTNCGKNTLQCSDYNPFPSGSQFYAVTCRQACTNVAQCQEIINPDTICNPDLVDGVGGCIPVSIASTNESSDFWSTGGGYVIIALLIILGIAALFCIV